MLQHQKIQQQAIGNANMYKSWHGVGTASRICAEGMQQSHQLTKHGNSYGRRGNPLRTRLQHLFAMDYVHKAAHLPADLGCKHRCKPPTCGLTVALHAGATTHFGTGSRFFGACRLLHLFVCFDGHIFPHSLACHLR